MSKWIAEFDLEDGDTMPAHMDLNYMGAKIDFHCRPMWIPVTDGLPKPNETEDGIAKYYLIQNEFGDMMVACYCENSSGYTWWQQMYTNDKVEDEVIAYMPLPAPYERSEL